MDPTVFIGITVAITLIMNAIGIETGLRLFFHPESLLIVLGGTLGATLVHFPISQIGKCGSWLGKIFTFKKTQNYLRDIEFMMTMSKRCKKEGLYALEEEIKSIKDHFLRKAFQLLMDKKNVEALETILREKIEYMQNRHHLGLQFFTQMAKYAPGFGLIGTLIGLIQMLAELDDPNTLGPSMSVALVTTFYGVLLANLVFVPLSGRLKISSREEVTQKEMLLKGIICIANNESSFVMREKMTMLLPEKERLKLKKTKK